MTDAPLRLALVTDAWAPQVNGVVNALTRVTGLLRARGDTVTVVAPERFRTVPCPTYPEIRLALASPASVARAIEASGAEFVHIATEGPLGMLARRHCLASGRGFTTSYHTRFPEYVSARIPVPEAWTYAIVRRFHNSGLGCMVATPSIRAELAARGFRNLMRWSRGVDTALFRPRPGADLGLARPVFLYVGRVAVEKNLDAFLSLDLPGSKVVVGDGPARAALSRRYPDARFLGVLQGETLAHAYAAADVFVFPSLTDTFGNVIVEGLASGLPVAAFPVAGPRDIITDPAAGVLDADLRKAALLALDLRREAARDFAKRFSWEASAAEFRANIVAANGGGARIAA
jgi:glycosyltransferase involved in cell wall biosynthesis